MKPELSRRAGRKPARNGHMSPSRQLLTSSQHGSPTDLAQTEIFNATSVYSRLARKVHFTIQRPLRTKGLTNDITTTWTKRFENHADRDRSMGDRRRTVGIRLGSTGGQ